MAIPQSTIEQPELAALGSLGERIDAATRTVDSFVGRFRGATPDDACSPPPREGYLGDIDRATYAIDRLETAVRELNRIG